MERGHRFFAASARTKRADAAWQGKRQPDGAKRQVNQNEEREEQDDRQAQRDLDAVRWYDQQQIAVIDTRCQRNPDRHGTECQ